MSNTLHHHNLGSLFDEVVVHHATRPALRYVDREHSYAELGQWVDSLALLLCSKGLRRGDVIAIGHEKQVLSYALMLAAIRLGIPYVNIDVASPTARNIAILTTSVAALLFYDDANYRHQMAELGRATDCEVMLLDEAQLLPIGEDEREVQWRLSSMVDGSTIAYIMFTSGSTGVPKGVAVTHQNVLHFIAWGRERFAIAESDNFANLSPMYFDNSVFDFYVGLFSGASLSPVHRSLLARPYELVSRVSEQACTIWFSVPSLLMYLMAMKAMAAGTLLDLRFIVFGGEGYPKVELKKLFDRFWPQATLVNVYGPTECTCICSGHTLAAQDFQDLKGLPPLGRLNPNFDYRILTEADHDAPEGELCLIGPNVAAGYFNDLTRTLAAFQTILEANRFMKRMYRTGDLVKEVDGMLHFVGRKDNQIKHLGHRIELEEIELALAKLPHVNQAAVIYHRSQAAYGKLVAYIASHHTLDHKALLKALGELVPDYMVPGKLVVMPHLPKNANGKIDRQYLLALLDSKMSS